MIDDHEMDDGALIFYPRVGKLADLAMVSLTATLIHHKITLILQNDEFDEYIDEADLIHDPVPEKIKNKIVNLTEEMNRAWVKWWTYHHRRVFSSSKESDDVIDLLDQIVWLSDGSISYVQTAKKLLNGAKLTKLDKLKMACAYCFVDEVEHLKSSLTQDEWRSTTDEFRKFDSSFWYYWLCKMYGMPDNLNPYRRDEIFQKLILFLQNYDENWSPIEYFWNFSGNEQRLPEANDIINLDRPLFTFNLLQKLTDPELDLVFQQNSKNIMHSLAKNENYLEYTIITWKRVVNVIDNGTLAFIIDSLDSLPLARFHVNNLMSNIWRCTSDQQKKFIAEWCYNFINEEHEKNYNYPLIIDVLSYSTPQRRYDYWMKNWTKLVSGQLQNHSGIELLMKLCLGDDENIANFKNTTMVDFDSINLFCQELLKTTRFEHLQKFLQFCSSDAMVIQNFKKEIMKSLSPIYVFDFFVNVLLYDSEAMTEFNSYIEEVFTSEESAEFRSKVAMDPKVVRQLNILIRVSGTFHKAMEFVDQFCIRKEDLIKIKLNVLENLQLNEVDSIPRQIEKKTWLDVMVWCFDGDKSMVEQWKKLLNWETVSQNAEKSNVKKKKQLVSINKIYCNWYLRK